MRLHKILKKICYILLCFYYSKYEKIFKKQNWNYHQIIISSKIKIKKL